MWIEQEIIRLLLIIVLAFILGLEREIKHQPAWIRTHILIWLGSTLIMMLSIEMAANSTSINADPARLAAQVVSWIWFIWAWVIMKMWFSTKWLTTAANIWVTAAIWLAVWAWMYTLAILTTILIILNLTVITKLKQKYIKKSRYCHIKINFKKKNTSHTSIIKTLNSLPINITSKEIIEDGKKVTLEIYAKIEKDISIDTIHRRIKYSDDLSSVSVSENLR